MGAFIDRVGNRHGRLIVLRRDTATGPASGMNRTRWICQCDCGNTISVTGHALGRGETKSCGCLQREQTANRSKTHGLAGSPTYRSWQAAKDRCHNPNNSKYAAYGGSGITMCDEWSSSFEAFLRDVGMRPAGHTLDRLDQCKGYEPGNVKWSTAREQSENRGTTKLYRWRGTWMTTREIAEIEGISFNSIRKIVRQHRTIQAAVSYVKERAGRKGIQNLRAGD